MSSPTLSDDEVPAWLTIGKSYQPPVEKLDVYSSSSDDDSDVQQIRPDNTFRQIIGKVDEKRTHILGSRGVQLGTLNIAGDWDLIEVGQQRRAAIPRYRSVPYVIGLRPSCRDIVISTIRPVTRREPKPRYHTMDMETSDIVPVPMEGSTHTFMALPEIDVIPTFVKNTDHQFEIERLNKATRQEPHDPRHWLALIDAERDAMLNVYEVPEETVSERIESILLDALRYCPTSLQLLDMEVRHARARGNNDMLQAVLLNAFSIGDCKMLRLVLQRVPRQIVGNLMSGLHTMEVHLGHVYVLVEVLCHLISIELNSNNERGGVYLALQVVAMLGLARTQSLNGFSNEMVPNIGRVGTLGGLMKRCCVVGLDKFSEVVETTLSGAFVTELNEPINEISYFALHALEMLLQRQHFALKDSGGMIPYLQMSIIDVFGPSLVARHSTNNAEFHYRVAQATKNDVRMKCVKECTGTDEPEELPECFGTFFQQWESSLENVLLGCAMICVTNTDRPEAVLHEVVRSAYLLNQQKIIKAILKLHSDSWAWISYAYCLYHASDESGFSNGRQIFSKFLANESAPVEGLMGLYCYTECCLAGSQLKTSCCGFLGTDVENRGWPHNLTSIVCSFHETRSITVDKLATHPRVLSAYTALRKRLYAESLIDGCGHPLVTSSFGGVVVQIFILETALKGLWAAWRFVKESIGSMITGTLDDSISAGECGRCMEVCLSMVLDMCVASVDGTLSLVEEVVLFALSKFPCNPRFLASLENITTRRKLQFRTRVKFEKIVQRQLLAEPALPILFAARSEKRLAFTSRSRLRRLFSQLDI